VCLEASVPLCNCIPVFVASDPKWEARFAAAGLPLVGDDMRSQFGASVLSQMLQELAFDRGHHVQCHVQQNSGGNTDFLNMTDKSRLASKKISKENVIRAQVCRRKTWRDGREACPAACQRLRPCAHAQVSRLTRSHTPPSLPPTQNELRGVPTDGSFLHAGPSDYIAW